MSILQAAKRQYRRIKLAGLMKKQGKLSASEAEKHLQAFYPRSAPAFAQNNCMDPLFDVMIIVPVYNVQAYLEQCIASVLNQKTDYSYQAVFIDDGATDDSGEILDRRVPAPHTVIHKKNGGLSSARNHALQKITGRYVMFLDSDDYLSEDAVDIMVREADRKNADIVECGHAFFDADKILQSNIHAPVCQEIPRSELYGFAWGKLIRSELLREFCFPEGFWFEDTVMSAFLHPLCRRVISVPQVGYYYRDNAAGITQSSKKSKQSVDTFWMMKYCLEERIRRGQKLTQNDYERYLTAVRRNWVRTQNLPGQIQESIFVLTCEMFRELLPFSYSGHGSNIKLLEKTILSRSYEAFCFLMDRWEIM